MVEHEVGLTKWKGPRGRVLFSLMMDKSKDKDLERRASGLGWCGVIWGLGSSELILLK